MQKVGFRPTEQWDLQYALHYSETSDYARYDRHTRIKKGLPQYGEWNYGPQVWMLNQFTAQHRAQHLFYDRMAVRLAVQRFEESRIDRRFNKTARTTTEEIVDACSAGGDFTKDIARHTMYYGVEYVNNDVTSKGIETNVETREDKPAYARYPQSQWESYAAYVQALFRLSGKLNVEAGVRYNYYRLSADFSNNGLELGFAPKQNNHKGALSGSVGLTCRPAADWLLSINAGRGFRTPNVDDMGKLYDSVDGAVVVPNPGLKPEYAHNVELGIVKTFGHFLKLYLSAYRSGQCGRLKSQLISQGDAYSVVAGGHGLGRSPARIGIETYSLANFKAIGSIDDDVVVLITKSHRDAIDNVAKIALHIMIAFLGVFLPQQQR